MARSVGQRRKAQTQRLRRWPRLPYATFALSLLLILGYLLALSYPGGVAGANAVWGESPGLIAGGGSVPGTALPAWATMMTSIFLHVRPAHLLANLSLLLLVGAVVEYILGASGLLLVFFASALSASMVCTALVRQSTDVGCGASGAVSGVLCAWLVLLAFDRDNFFTGYWPDSNWAAMASLLEIVLRIGLAAVIGFYWLAPPILLLATGNWYLLRTSYSDVTHLTGFVAGGVLALLVLGYYQLRIRIYRQRLAQRGSRPRTWDEYVARINAEIDAQPEED